VQSSRPGRSRLRSSPSGPSSSASPYGHGAFAWPERRRAVATTAGALHRPVGPTRDGLLRHRGAGRPRVTGVAQTSALLYRAPNELSEEIFPAPCTPSAAHGHNLGVGSTPGHPVHRPGRRPVRSLRPRTRRSPHPRWPVQPASAGSIRARAHTLPARLDLDNSPSRLPQLRRALPQSRFSAAPPRRQCCDRGGTRPNLIRGLPSAGIPKRRRRESFMKLACEPPLATACTLRNA
jgi:hypothetical protein